MSSYFIYFVCFQELYVEVEVERWVLYLSIPAREQAHQNKQITTSLLHFLPPSQAFLRRAAIEPRCSAIAFLPPSLIHSFPQTSQQEEEEQLKVGTVVTVASSFHRHPCSCRAELSSSSIARQTGSGGLGLGLGLPRRMPSCRFRAAANICLA